MEFLALTQANIATWHGVEPPNDAGKRLAAELANTIKAYESLRDGLRFEDEPASFETALQATKEQGT